MTSGVTMTVPAGYSTAEIKQHTFSDFKYQHSATAQRATIAYRSLNAGASKTALIPTCYGGRINETSEAFHYASHSLAAYHVVIVAMLGNGESSSPSNDAGCPGELDYRDCVHAQHRLLTEVLGWTHLDVVVGFSMGGQQAYYWACMHPEFLRGAVAVCTSAKTSAHNHAFLSGPEAALCASRDYAEFASRDGKGEYPRKGLEAFGRAWCAWGRSAAWFRAGLWKSGGCESIEQWVREEGGKGFADWHPENLLILLRMWQRGDVGVFDDSGKGDYERALAAVKVPLLVMPSRTDTYFPPEDSEIEIKHLKHGTLRVIESVWGHTAGAGLDPADLEFLDKQIAEFVKQR